MTFQEIIEKLRDGKAYQFGHENLTGYFYKAPFPEDETQTTLDGAVSAITYWEGNTRASSTLMLHDFDDDCEWYCNEVTRHPSLAAID